MSLSCVHCAEHRQILRLARVFRAFGNAGEGSRPVRLAAPAIVTAPFSQRTRF
jgi:hypothetical protein